MIITGAILVSIAGTIAISNIWDATWTQMKTSVALGVVGFALIAAVIAASGVVAWRAERPEWSVVEATRACGRPVLGALFGFLTPALVLQVWVGYPTFRVVWMCLRNNALPLRPI